MQIGNATLIHGDCVEQIQSIETELRLKKKLEDRSKELKEQLLKAMQDNNIKSWQTQKGTKITVVKGKQKEIKKTIEFDIERFKQENEEMYKNYLVDIEKVTSARKGFIKITLSKEEENE